MFVGSEDGARANTTFVSLRGPVIVITRFGHRDHLVRSS